MNSIYSLWYVPHYFNPEEPLQIKITTKDGVVVKDAPEPPYMFVETDREKIAGVYCRRFRTKPTIEQTELTTLDGKSGSIVAFHHPKQVPDLRDQMPLQTYEADVKYADRLMIDFNWNVATDYRKVYFDLEAWDAPTNEKYRRNQIIGASLIDLEGNLQYLVEDDEKVLLERLIGALQPYQMPIGWSIEAYDILAISKACKMYRIPFEVQQWSWLDLTWALRMARQRMLGSWQLQYAAKTILKKSRIYHAYRIHQLTTDQIEERCLLDSQLVLELDKKLGLSDSTIAKASVSHIFPNEAVFAGACVDALHLRKARDLGYILPTKPKGRKQHSGALILQPPEPFKIYRNVAVYDFASLYPSIILSRRISPDKEKRLFPELVEHLIDRRMEWKEKSRSGDDYADTQQKAYKIILNAIYGYYSRRVGREDLGDEVATTGRQILMHTIKFLSDNDFSVIFGDTDSLAIPLSNFDDNVAFGLEHAISGEVLERFNIDVECECDRFFSSLYFPRIAAGSRAAKKRYCGTVVWRKGKGTLETPELEIVGLEAIRSDVPAAFQGFQTTLMALKLNGASRDTLMDAVLTFHSALMKGMIPPEDLAIYKTLTKDEYKVKVHHAIAAKKALERGLGKFVVGDKVGYIYTLRGIEPLEPTLTDISYGLYWKKMAVPIIERTIGIEFEDDVHKLDFFT